MWDSAVDLGQGSMYSAILVHSVYVRNVSCP
jgi:hypothetical protein